MATARLIYMLNPNAYIVAFKQAITDTPAHRVVYTIFSLFSALVVYRLVYAFYLSPLSKLPGPLLGKLTSLCFKLHKMLGLGVKVAREDLIKYGDIYMCTPNAVAISHPDDIRAVVGNPAVKKGLIYKIFKFTDAENITSMLDNKDAGVRHRQILPYFQPRHLIKMQDIIMEQGIHSIKGRWDRLLGESDTGKVEVNYSDDSLVAAFGVLSRLVFGRTLDEIKSADAAAARWIEKTFKYVGIRVVIHILPSFIAKVLFWPWEHYFTRFSNCAHEAIMVRKKLISKLEAEGRADETPVDFLQALIDAEDSETSTRMSYDEIHSESLTIMAAGSESTALTITWTIHLLMLYPQHYKRAVKEVRSCYSRDHVITYNECRETLPFVEACVYESMRVQPVINGMLSRVSPKGGIVLRGHYIPEGAGLFINMGPANHHSKYWERPYEYDPTRFVKDREAWRNLLSFSHGPRSCPGRYLAMWEMLTILPNILKDYDFELPADYTHLGPSVLDERGLPKIMDAKTFVTCAPTNAERDCRLVISKASSEKA